MRLIDADELLKWISGQSKSPSCPKNESAFGLRIIKHIDRMPSVQPDIIRCKDCKHWRQQTNYQGTPLSFGFCESENMWCSLYGETTEVAHIDTDDNHYCSYAERRTDER